MFGKRVFKGVGLAYIPVDYNFNNFQKQFA